MERRHLGVEKRVTYATALGSGRFVNADVSLLIDGIPVLHASRKGLVHPLDNVTNPPDAGLISVDSIMPGSLSIGMSQLDLSKMAVPPGNGAAGIRIDSPKPDGGWNRWFETQRGPFTQLSSQATESDTILNVDLSVDVFNIGDVIYCNREAMLVTDVEPGTLEVVRNYCALRLAKAATHQQGALISTVPQNLMGREAELRIWPSLDPADSIVMRYLFMAGSPERHLNKGMWSLDFSDIARVFSRKVAIGFRGSALALGTFGSQGSGTGAIATLNLTPTDNFREFTADPSTEPVELGCIALTGPAGGFIAPIVGYDDDHNPTITNVPSFGEAQFPGPPLTGTAFYQASPDGQQNQIQMRRCYVLQGPPLLDLIRLATSDTGLQQNGAHDVLYGQSSTATSTDGRLSEDNEIRFGAAIPASMIAIPDDDDPLMSEMSPGWCRVVMEEENFLDVLCDAMLAINCIAYVNSDGQLAFKRLDSAYSTDPVTLHITRDHILVPETEFTSRNDESQVVHTVAIKCNWDPIQKVFLGTEILKDAQLQETYREVSATFQTERKGLVTANPGRGATQIAMGIQAPLADFASITSQMDRTLYRRKRMRIYTLVLPFVLGSQLACGDRVSLTFEQFIDFAGNSLSSFPCDIWSVAPDINKGTITIEVHELLAGKLVSPTVQVASWDNGTKTFTLVAGSMFQPDSTPGQWFAVGWKIRCIQWAMPLGSVVSGVLTIVSVTDTTIRVTGTVGFTPAASDLIVEASYNNADNTTANVMQSAAQRDYLFLANSAALLGSGNAAADKWG